jgi:hypothetical protein
VKRFQTLVAGTFVMFAALGAGLAQGATIATSTLYQGSAQASIFCIATNVGTKDLTEVVSELISPGGDVLSSVSCPTLVPAAVCQASTALDAALCRIHFKGSRKAMRGAGSVNSLTGNNIEVIEPAR